MQANSETARDLKNFFKSLKYFMFNINGKFNKPRPKTECKRILKMQKPKKFRKLYNLKIVTFYAKIEENMQKLGKSLHSVFIVTFGIKGTLL